MPAGIKLELQNRGRYIKKVLLPEKRDLNVRMSAIPVCSFRYTSFTMMV